MAKQIRKNPLSSHWSTYKQQPGSWSTILCKRNPIACGYKQHLVLKVLWTFISKAEETDLCAQCSHL